MHKPRHLKDECQIWNVAALRFTCGCEIQAQPSSSFWRGSNRGQIKKHIKVTSLNCQGKVKLQVALLIVLCGPRPLPGDCLEYKGFFSLTFCFFFWNLPVGNRLLSMSLHPYSITENHWLCSNCRFTRRHLAGRKHIANIFFMNFLRSLQTVLNNPSPCPEKKFNFLLHNYWNGINTVISSPFA